jgi:cytochrome c oxidase subunit 1
VTAEREQEERIGAAEEAAHGGIHMPDQSWFPFLAASALLVAGLCLANQYQWGAMAAGAAMFVAAVFWAFEGPGGYTIQPDGETPGGGVGPKG